MKKTMKLLVCAVLLAGIPGTEAFGRDAASRQREVLQARMSEIVLPEVRFEHAGIEDVISFLARASREADPDGIGINFVLLERRDAEAASAPVVHFELRNVTLLDTLDLVMAHAGMSYRVERGILMVEPRGSARLETRFYSVDPSLFDQRVRALQGR